MAKREKFIIVLAILAILGYAGSFLFSGDSEKPAKGQKQEASVSKGDRLEEIKQSIADTKKEVDEAKPSDLSVYVVANSGRAFPADPFYFRTEAVEMSPEESISEERVGPSIELTYTGFIEIGTTRMAIVNDLEYEVGDDVAGTGFLLRSVRPDWVEIESREGKYFLRIPFVEEG